MNFFLTPQNDSLPLYRDWGFWELGWEFTFLVKDSFRFEISCYKDLLSFEQSCLKAVFLNRVSVLGEKSFMPPVHWAEACPWQQEASVSREGPGCAQGPVLGAQSRTWGGESVPAGTVSRQRSESLACVGYFNGTTPWGGCGDSPVLQVRSHGSGRGETE